MTMKRLILLALCLSLLAAAPLLAQDPPLDILSASSLNMLAGLTTPGSAHLGAHLKTHYHVECVRQGRLAWVEDCDNRTTTLGLNAYLTNTLKGGTGGNEYVGLVGATAADGTVSSGSAAFTSASGAFTAADVGQPITVKGAGASGADLNTTISAYTSATAVTLAANAGTSVTTAGYLVGCRLADTMSSHSPWVETAPYSNATRPQWNGGTVASGSVSNSGSVAAFTINASGTIYGAFMNSDSTVSGTAGTLFGMAPFANSRAVLSGDTVNVTITCSIS
jgi:hypothetical protein